MSQVNGSDAGAGRRAAAKQQPLASGWILPESLPQEDQRIIKALHSIVECKSMAEHLEAFKAFSDAALWDSPPAAPTGRDVARVAFYAVKTMFEMSFDVFFAKREVLDSSGRRRLHLDVLFHVMPLKPWWLGPVGLVIPDDIQIRGHMTVGVRPRSSPETGVEIDWVLERWHNLPVLPWVARHLPAQLFFQGLHLAEPLWSKALPLIGDDSLMDRARDVPMKKRI